MARLRFYSPPGMGIEILLRFCILTCLTAFLRSTWNVIKILLRTDSLVARLRCYSPPGMGIKILLRYCIRTCLTAFLRSNWNIIQILLKN